MLIVFAVTAVLCGFATLVILSDLGFWTSLVIAMMVASAAVLVAGVVAYFRSSRSDRCARDGVAFSGDFSSSEK
jgi:hypothetical protein